MVLNGDLFDPGPKCSQRVDLGGFYQGAGNPSQGVLFLGWDPRADRAYVPLALLGLLRADSPPGGMKHARLQLRCPAGAFLPPTLRIP